MTFGYAQPFTFQIGGNWAKIGGNSAKVSGNPVKVAAIRNGVTEVILSDGRLLRASLQIKDISPSRQKPGSLDISYNIVTEIVQRPDAPVHAAHETLQ
jgi:hypothetical protein